MGSAPAAQMRFEGSWRVGGNLKESSPPVQHQQSKEYFLVLEEGLDDSALKVEPGW